MSAAEQSAERGGASDNPSIPLPQPVPEPAPRTLASYERRDVRTAIASIRKW